jgi:hypothetical protein
MAYEVFPYTFEHFSDCLYKQAGAHKEVIERKQHLVCFKNYFEHIGVVTVLVEPEYVNRDFLEDYSSYYVRSFKEYRRSCIRIHFFSFDFTKEDFSKVLKGEHTDGSIFVAKLQESYLGFMVVKPLPVTIIGKTCLVTYETAGRRYFPAVRTYQANLFGIPLSVDSLAYQEQDSIVSACASSAVWTVFHGTGILFQHALPSPVEITKWATKHFPFANRHFPNKGLTAEQMSLAIREVGLEPFLFNARSMDVLRASVYAYLKAKIPVVLGFSLWDLTKTPPLFGKHAVAVTGYSLGDSVGSDYDGIHGLRLSGSRIDKIYAHDDQMGPFSMLEVVQTPTGIPGGGGQKCLLTTWYNKSGTMGSVYATPEIVIVPLYHKIRIPFSQVLEVIIALNNICLNITAAIPSFQPFEWDIHLCDVRDVKHDILNNDSISSNDKEVLLTAKVPKYIWKAIGIQSNNQKFQLLFDATDIDQGSFFLRRIDLDSSIVGAMALILARIDVHQIQNLTLKELIESFR